MNSFKFVRGLIVVGAVALLAPGLIFADTPSEKSDKAPEATPTHSSESVSARDNAEKASPEATTDSEDQQESGDANEETDSAVNGEKVAPTEPTEIENDQEEATVGEESDTQNEEPKSDEKANTNEPNGKGAERRSKVANAVHELLAIADREGGIGEQVRAIAKSQQSSSDDAEKALEAAKTRKGWVRMLIGPNYKELNLAQDRLAEITKQLEDLKNLRNQLTTPEDVTLLDTQVAAIKQLQTELQAEVQDSEKGFSLFGWLGKLLSK